MKHDPEDDKVVLGMDILAPEGYGEIIGGSEREINLDILIKRIKNEGLNQEDYQWYLDLRKYGAPFGIWTRVLRMKTVGDWPDYTNGAFRNCFIVLFLNLTIKSGPGEIWTRDFWLS